MFSRRELVAAGAGLAAQAVSATPGNAAPMAADALGARLYNVRDYGAKGDGKTLDTAAVQSAIDACAKDRGGTVLVPAGDFLVGTVELKSNVTLHLAAAGRLLGSATPGDFSAGKGVPPSNGNVVLLYAVEAENVTVEGRGTIDGQGDKFFTGHGDNTGPGQNRAAGYTERPHLCVFYRCRNLGLRDIFLTRSAYHCTRIIECSYVRLDGVRIHNRVNMNNDGFHLNSNQYVNIVNCNVACQDDACALFGSNQFVTITNCTFSTRWSIFRFGGGEAKNIPISNCVLVMTNVTGPISIGLDSTSRRSSASGTPREKGVVRNLSFSGIRATVVAEGRQYADMAWKQNYRPGETRTCITLNGAHGDYLEGITFNDIHITYAGGGTAEEAARRDVPQMAGEYFELGTLPAYGLWARNVRGLEMSNVRFEVEAADLRPAVVLDHVEDAAVSLLSTQGNARAESVLRLIESRDVLLAGCRVLTPAAVFLHVEGAGSAGIRVNGGDLSKAATPLTTAAEVHQGIVTMV
jgi:hypothetical protein